MSAEDDYHFHPKGQRGRQRSRFVSLANSHQARQIREARLICHLSLRCIGMYSLEDNRGFASKQPFAPKVDRLPQK